MLGWEQYVYKCSDLWVYCVVFEVIEWTYYVPELHGHV